MDQPTAYQPANEPQDRITPTKSIYEAGYGEIFAKNFLAGASRAVGGIFLYTVFLLIGINIFITYAWPHVKPFIDEYRQAVQIVTQTQTKQLNPQQLNQYQQFIKDLDSSLPR